MSRFHIGLTVACALALSACGGGESPKRAPVEPVVPKSRDVVVSSNSFSVALPLKAMVDPSAYQQYELHGSCAGAAEVQKSASVAEVRQIGWRVSDLTEVLVSNFSYTVNNKPLDTQYSCDTGEPGMVMLHFDSNQEWIGLEETGEWHAIYDDRSGTSSSYRALPSTVKAFDSGTLRIFNVYSWGGQTSQTGRIKWSYETNPLTADTVEIVFKTLFQNCGSSCASLTDARLEEMHYVLGGNSKMLFWKRVVTNKANSVSVTYCAKGVDCTQPLIDHLDLFATALNN